MLHKFLKDNKDSFLIAPFRFSEDEQIDHTNLFLWGNKLIDDLSANENYLNISPLKSNLQAKNRQRDSKNKKILKEVKNIASKLDSEKIEYVFLKGSALLFTIYQDNPSKRAIEDIDILISESDFKRTIQAIEELGFRENYKIKGFKSHELGKEHFNESHHLVFSKEEIILELHKRISLSNEINLNNFIFEKKVKLKTDQTQICIPSGEDLAIHLMLNILNDKLLGLNSCWFFPLKNRLYLFFKFIHSLIEYKRIEKRHFLNYQKILSRLNMYLETTSEPRMLESLFVVFYFFCCNSLDEFEKSNFNYKYKSSKFLKDYLLKMKSKKKSVSIVKTIALLQLMTEVLDLKLTNKRDSKLWKELASLAPKIVFVFRQ